MYIDQNLRKALTDRIYDKRKPAALQLEQIVRKGIDGGSTELVEGIITELSRDYAYALRHPNYRNGGLIGLAGVAIALGQSNLPAYLDDIIQPILACFGDADWRVRYYACESLYNVAKVAKGEILAYFNEVFDILCKLTADSEESVRNGANLVDQLMRDIVVETAATYVFVVDREPPKVPPAVDQPEGPEGPSFQRDAADIGSSQEGNSFSLPRFIPLLVERIYVIDPSTRMFLVQWIMLLDSIPDLELVKYLPEFLDGILLFVADSNKEIRTFTKTCLNGFLKEIRGLAELRRASQKEAELSKGAAGSNDQNVEAEGNVKQGENKKYDDNKGDTDNTKDEDTKYEDAKDVGLYRVGQDTFINHAQIIDILLGKMDPQHAEMRLVVLEWLEALLDVSPTDVFAKLSSIVSVLLSALSDEFPEIRQSGKSFSDRLLQLIPSQADSIDEQAAVNALAKHLEAESKVTRLAIFDWLAAIHKAKSLTKFQHDLLGKLLGPLSDPSDEVVAQDLRLLALILQDTDSSGFTNFVRRLLAAFRNDRQLFSQRGKVVCSQMCALLSPERVYQTFAEIIDEETDEDFARLFIQNLNNILITSPELSQLRSHLKQLHSAEGANLFTTLFKSWCRNSVAALALCLLTEAYEQSFSVLQVLARLDVTVGTLIQIDKLVQFLEGPVFAPLRMHLLVPSQYPFLYKTLYGILMVLPQSQAFKTLGQRLQSVSGIAALSLDPSPLPTHVLQSSDNSKLVNWKELLELFERIHTKDK